jgi:hypothetical protein
MSMMMYHIRRIHSLDWQNHRVNFSFQKYQKNIHTKKYSIPTIYNV